jgi:hypothetical protein
LAYWGLHTFPGEAFVVFRPDLDGFEDFLTQHINIQSVSLAFFFAGDLPCVSYTLVYFL